MSATIHSIADAKYRSLQRVAKASQKRRETLDEIAMRLRSERYRLQLRLAMGSHIVPDSVYLYPDDILPDLKVPDLKLEERCMILHRMAQIDTAMRQLTAGKYGFCRECDTRIGSRRLAAQPATTLCINCHYEIEGHSKKWQM